jgi:carbamoylphosphate synthase large subunit
MKRILITAGGTAIAWHICQIANEFFNEDVEVQICDINDASLVPASTIAKRTHVVPMSNDQRYLNIVQNIIKKENIDVIVPLLPQEAYLFASDSEFIKENKIVTLAASLKTNELLTDKLNLFNTLTDLNIPTPNIYKLSDISKEKKYIIKPRLGFGSVGTKIVSGEILNEESDTLDLENNIIQEYCNGSDYDEVTVEIFNGSVGLRIFARRRIATKAGVCVKMEPVDNTPFMPYIKKLVNNIDCPIAFNVQFLRDAGKWKLFDCNLRLGAGTALSTAIGFELTRAMIAEIVDLPIDDDWFSIDEEVKSVLRVYKEVVVK